MKNTKKFVTKGIARHADFTGTELIIDGKKYTSEGISFSDFMDALPEEHETLRGIIWFKESFIVAGDVPDRDIWGNPIHFDLFGYFSSPLCLFKS